MQWANGVAALIFSLSAAVQWNDPDPLPWMIAYGVCAGTAYAAARGRSSPILSAFAFLVAVFPTLPLLPSLLSAEASSFTSVGMDNLRDEEAREALGLLIAGAWMLVLLRGHPEHRGVLGSCLLLALASSSCSATPVTPHGPAVVARGLANPRGIIVEENGGLLIATAGSGGEISDGALVRVDREGKKQVLLGGQPTRNLVELVRRDEVFGLAALEKGDEEILFSAAFFEGPSRVYAWTNGGAQLRAKVAGNLNDLAWDPRRSAWFAVSSSSEELLRLEANGSAARVLTFPALAQGQDAVPGYLRPDPRSGDLLVSLFSGSPLGEEGGDGTEILAGAGSIVAVNPDTGAIRPVVKGLTAPTDLDISDDGRYLRVLELCSDLLDPTPDRETLLATRGHGGFRRFSGRLLEIDRDEGTARVLATGLDTPTNLARDGERLYIAQGMGTPGRPIPAPGGAEDASLDGFIGVLDLSAIPRLQP